MNHQQIFSTNLASFDRDKLIASVRVLINYESAVIRIDFKKHLINDIKWGNGNNFADELPEIDSDAESSIPHNSQWELAGQWLGALISPHKMRMFAKASISKFIEGPVSLPVLDHRHQCCHGVNLAGDEVSEPCVSRYETATGVYCKTCGCPEYSMADISVDADNPTKSKLAFPALECPMNKYSAVSGRRREAWNAH